MSGTASDQLFGTCEGLWEPDLEPEDLFETCAQALLNAVDRDALSGWGAHVYVITKDKIIKRLLKGIFCPRVGCGLMANWHFGIQEDRIKLQSIGTVMDGKRRSITN